MLEELKQAPESVSIGQIIFLASVVAFVVSVVIDIIVATSLANYTIFGVLVACAIGIITSALKKEEYLKFIVIDLVVTAFLFIAYAQVFSF